MSEEITNTWELAELLERYAKQLKKAFREAEARAAKVRKILKTAFKEHKADLTKSFSEDGDKIYDCEDTEGDD